MMRRREFVASVIAAIAAHPRCAAAQPSTLPYPTRPVRFIVPLAPGGGLDFVARVVAEHVSRTIGQQVVIENKTGGGGTIGVETVIKSPPDGYTVLVSNDNVASAPHILKLNVDFLAELIPVAQLSRQAQTLAVHPSLGVSSVAELVARAKEKPGLGYASSGVGSNQHVLAEWFCQRAGIKMEHVPYRGAGQATNDLLAGHVQIGFLGPTALISHVKAGNLRFLAQSAARRAPSLPEVPTLVESGFDGLVLETWYGAFVPLATPAPIVARLNAAIGLALADQATRTSFAETATEAVDGSPEEFARVTQADAAKYARLAKELDIRVK